MKQTAANIYYFRRISRIGGTEQFLYEMAKKYYKYDLAILYDEADFDQLMRLKKLVKCIRRKPNEKYYAERAFYNFNLEALPQIEAKEHIFICHAIYQQIDQVPPLTHPKLTRWIGVSKYACEELKKYGEYLGKEIKPELCYNPISLEKPGKVMRLISACRLDDKVKGGARTLKLIQALDDYCQKTDNHYLWTIYTNTVNFTIPSENVALMRPRIDVRPFIADADWLLQLSNDMESYCYSINEALGYGLRIVRTPLSVAKELKIPKEAELVLEYDASNVNEIAEKIFEPKQDFDYKFRKDGWDKLLVKKPSQYVFKEEKIKVKALKSFYDLELKQNVSNWTPAWEVTIPRAKELANKGLIRIL
ncbi:hypothetical protein [Fibrobacter sp.]|uniref:hypothetical protein n=1 Tax=Fibrobacter sp. TaxID=35828 RepID=UPI00389030EC